MIFPYEDINPSEKVPYVTYGLIGLNVLIFLLTFEWLLLPPEEQLQVLRNNGALVPAQAQPLDFITSMFLHGGMMHLGGNMLFLWITGDNIESRFGRFYFLVFYIICGVVASWAHIGVDPNSQIPTIGASGAISGVMGAYLVLFPRSRIKIFYWIYFFIGRTTIGAVWWIGLWIVFQIIQSGATGGSGGGVAYMAHIGGFTIGALIAAGGRYFDWVEGGVNMKKIRSCK